MASTLRPTTSAEVNSDTLLGVLWAGVVLSLAFVLTRIYIRFKVFHKLSIDDYFLITAWLMALVNSAIWQVRWKELYFGIEIASRQITVIPANIDTLIVNFLRSILGSYLVQYTALWCVKFSFLFFFHGLGRNIKLQRIVWWCTLAFLIISYIICIATVDYRCLGSSFERSLVVCFAPSTTRSQYVTLKLTTAFDVLTDVSIILLPTNILWKVQLDWRKKLALLGLCSLTMFVIAVAITRVIVVTTRMDITLILLWGAVELSVAIIIACLVSFRALFTRPDGSYLSAKKPVNGRTGGPYRPMAEVNSIGVEEMQNKALATKDSFGTDK